MHEEYEGMPTIIFSASQVEQVGGPDGMKAVIDAACAEYRRLRDETSDKRRRGPDA